jgi:hypothetical protein
MFPTGMAMLRSIAFGSQPITEADPDSHLITRSIGAQIHQICALALTHTQWPEGGSDRILFVVVVVKWLAGFSSAAARTAAWPP